MIAYRRWADEQLGILRLEFDTCRWLCHNAILLSAEASKQHRFCYGTNVLPKRILVTSEIWRSELKGIDFVNVVFQDGDLYATTKGELFRLDPATGKILWQNPLKGLGWGCDDCGPTSFTQFAFGLRGLQRGWPSA
jgi:hypothetical protein